MIMPSEPANSRPSVPDEADFLAWVEGEPLPKDREAAVGRALTGDRALARRLEAMRADRAAIKALPTIACPASLMAGVEAALQPVLERQMRGAAIAAHTAEPLGEETLLCLPLACQIPVKKGLKRSVARARPVPNPTASSAYWRRPTVRVVTGLIRPGGNR